MAFNIKGNRDGENGRNETYRIPGRGTHIPRAILVNEIKQGKHPHFEVYELNGEEYLRDKADNRIGNNINE